MKKILITLISFTFVTALMAQSKQWIDLTQYYVVNPSFEGNDIETGWEGTKFGSANPVENAEHWNRTYNSYQRISGLAAGTYRLSVSAFYRYGTSSQDYQVYSSGNYGQYQLASLYATSSIGEGSTALPLESSAALSYSLGGGVAGVGEQTGGWWPTYKYYIPNDMEAAHYWFEAGYYRSSCEVEVGSDGKLTIGVRKDRQKSEDWTCLDDFKLEYYGADVKVTSISVPSTMVMELGQTMQLVPTYQPSNALVKMCEWESSNSDVVTVDQQGNITAMHGGEAVITARTVDGSNRSAQCSVTVNFDGAAAGQVIINELMAANVDMYVDPSWNYGGWVELYNPTDHEVNVGTYWLSDDAENLQKARIPISVGMIPAKGFRTLWFDNVNTRKDVGEHWENTQIDMKLDCEGGVLYLSDDNGNVIASQDYPQAVMRTSYARKTDGADTWGMTAYPTPGSSNILSAFAAEQLPLPEVDQKGHIFSSPFTVNVTVPEGVTLRYTTDGSTPTMANGSTSTDGKFDISNKTTTLRFRSFKSGYLPSDVVTRTFVYTDKDYYLPVVSIVTDPKNLYDNTIGIYVTGTNGKTANQDYTKRNFNMEWDRPANMEFFNDDLNEDGYFAQEVDICISGGWSRKYEPRSFKLKSSKVYNLKKSLDYMFFPDKPYNKNKSLLLRNGGNDEYNQTRLKDAALQQIARQSQFPLNLQSYRPVHVFLNGKYHGMLNLREPSNKHFGYANYGIDTDEIDAFEMSVDSGYVQKDGTKEAFRQWYSLAENSTDALAWQQLLDLVDLDDYINYMAFKFHLNDWDWPHNNAKGFRDRNNGKFKFVVFDLDNCVDRTGNNIFYDFQGKQVHTFYTRPEYGGTAITAEVELVTIFLNMLQNEEFRRRFIDTYCLVGGSVFGDEQEIASIVNGIAANIAPALRWESNHSPYGSGRSKAQGIINAVTGSYRKNMINMLRNYPTFELYDKEPVQAFLSADVEGASISVNGINVPRSKFDGYLFSPIRLKATAPAGYKFQKWSGFASKEAMDEMKYELFGHEDWWMYFDQGSLDGEDWTSPDYDESDWAQGQALFGYHSRNDGAQINTTLDFGGNSSNKRPTYYFRKAFTLDDDPSEIEEFQMTVNFDDGYIIYINGTPVANERVEYGSSYGTYASAYGSDPYDTKTFSIDPGYFVQGDNVVAVELHNQSASSSDVYFDCSLSMILPSDDGGEGDLEIDRAEFSLPANTRVCDLMAIFTPLTSEEMGNQNLTPIRINEVSAGNSVNVNDYYKKDDWVELYNTTDHDIDLAGMYLTDKKSNPHKYQVPELDDPSATVIPAHGYKVIWCSKRNQLGNELHANFKLDNEDGKMVRIEAADGSWADSLVYCAHEGTQSVGRYVDGSNDIYLMSRPTIASSNIIDFYAESWIYVPEEDDPTGIDDREDNDRTASKIAGIYTVDGVFVGRSMCGLAGGLYIIKYADGLSRKVLNR